jgi:dynein heavy chain, axonemal
MPQVKQILDVMKRVEAKEACNMSAYNDEFAKFVKNQAVAKDFVKFLSTLERQFKNIQKGELQVIEETLPTLLTGLKLIWTISRHINH